MPPENTACSVKSPELSAGIAIEPVAPYVRPKLGLWVAKMFIEPGPTAARTLVRSTS